MSAEACLAWTQHMNGELRKGALGKSKGIGALSQSLPSAFSKYLVQGLNRSNTCQKFKSIINGNVGQVKTFWKKNPKVPFRLTLLLNLLFSL